MPVKINSPIPALATKILKAVALVGDFFNIDTIYSKIMPDKKRIAK